MIATAMNALMSLPSVAAVLVSPPVSASPLPVLIRSSVGGADVTSPRSGGGDSGGAGGAASGGCGDGEGGGGMGGGVCGCGAVGGNGGGGGGGSGIGDGGGDGGGGGGGIGGLGGGGDGAATASTVAVTCATPRTVTPRRCERSGIDEVVSMFCARCAAKT